MKWFNKMRSTKLTGRFRINGSPCKKYPNTSVKGKERIDLMDREKYLKEW